MGRRKRNQSAPACYHVTHRCHSREFLFKFRRDRQNYLMRLHEAARRYSADILTYMITSNHVHLLFWAERAADVSRLMHFLHGTVAGDYNRRKNREGAFWRGRYHPTLIETGTHLSRCLFYIDLNMVRAGGCKHPAEWHGGAYDELLGNRSRYRIINRERLKWCLGMNERQDEDFVQWYTATIAEKCSYGYFVREPFWSEALAVGSRQWVAGLLPQAQKVHIEAATGMNSVSEGEDSYALYMPKRETHSYWRTIIN